jgi:hypothetical protein
MIFSLFVKLRHPPVLSFRGSVPGFHVEKSKTKDGTMLSLSHVNVYPGSNSAFRFAHTSQHPRHDS